MDWGFDGHLRARLQRVPKTAQPTKDAITAPMREFGAYLKTHRAAFLLVFAIQLFLLTIIGIQNVPYIDDAGRQIDGYTQWGSWDGRWGSELIARLLNGFAPRVAELGITGFVLSAFFLTIAALIVVYLLVGEQANWLSFVAACVIGLNPWALNIISFRFDGPFAAISLLLAVGGLLWWQSRYPIAIGATAVAAFLLANFYQHTLGIGLALLVTLSLISYLRGGGVSRCYPQAVSRAHVWLCHRHGGLWSATCAIAGAG